MKTGVLLETLINISKISKTDFSIYLNMAPSSLSKILNGSRLPYSKEKKQFSRMAAGYFAEALYCLNCHMKLKVIFPAIYDFQSKFELENFLSLAIAYAINKDLDDESGSSLNFPNSELSYLGIKNILNMLCILTSDYIGSSDNESVEFFSTIPIYSPFFSDILQRVQLFNTTTEIPAIFHQFLSCSTGECVQKNDKTNYLPAIVYAQKSVNLHLWELSEKPDNPYLLLKGKYLLIFCSQPDGTPLMTCIRQKSHVVSCLTALLKMKSSKITYSQNEIKQILTENPSHLSKLLAQQSNSLFTSIPLGYLVNEEDLKNHKNDKNIKTIIIDFFKEVMTNDTEFFITIDAMMKFCQTGTVVVPLIGQIVIPPDRRIAYLKRLNHFIRNKELNKIMIINSTLPEMTVFSSDNQFMIYLHDFNQQDKVHTFVSPEINNILQREFSGNLQKIVHFTVELWDSYLDEMAIKIQELIS